nr:MULTISPECIES: hypothetical protein [Micrococcales]
MDHGIIKAVPCHAIDLVDNAELHGVHRHIFQHLLQRFTVCGLRRFAWLDELFDDHCPERGGFLLGGFALCRDRETFFEAVAGGLILGRDSQV